MIVLRREDPLRTLEELKLTIDLDELTHLTSLLDEKLRPDPPTAVRTIGFINQLRQLWQRQRPRM